MRNVAVQMYVDIKQELADGGRAFVVCPLVEETKFSANLLLKAAVDEQSRLKSEGSWSLLHQQLTKFWSTQDRDIVQSDRSAGTLTVDMRKFANQVRFYSSQS